MSLNTDCEFHSLMNINELLFKAMLDQQSVIYNYFQINKVYLDFKTTAALHFASTYDLKCACAW